MRSLRSRPVSGHRVTSGHRKALGVAALTAAVAVSGCSTFTSSEPVDAGPPRLTPNPRPEVAAAMIDGISEPGDLLNACELLDMTTEEIIDLTGAVMPEIDPTGSGDLGMVCIYGGPGSRERAVTAEEESEEESASGTAPEAAGSTSTAGTATESTTTAATAITSATDTTSTSATTTSPAFDPDLVPDTFAAGVVKPPSGSAAALAEQASLLGVRYACSDIRGEDPDVVATAPGAPEAPAPVKPELPTSYIDCAAAPTGGGLEVHTILVADNDLWHLVLLGPETPRSPEAEAEALAGLHRVAAEILS